MAKHFIEEWQLNLRGARLYSGRIDGDFGAATLAASQKLLPERVPAPVTTPVDAPTMKPVTMRRVILHWTAGADGVNEHEADSYHRLYGRDGTVYFGEHPIEANAGKKLVPGRYAAHTLNCNSGSIGVSLDAMAGAQERPFVAGGYPITARQLDAMARDVAGLCRTYGIAVTRQTVLTHAEVQPTLGIAQRQKWDITWLPGMTAPGDPVVVGDQLRAMIAAHL